MPYETQIALAVTVLFFLAGFIMSFLPIFPGTVVTWIGILVHKMWLWDASISWLFFGIATALVLTAQVVDIVFTYWGAKRFGATWRGGLGAVFGGIIGMLLFNVIGLILGPVIGAIVGEILGGRKVREAGKAGLGTVVGGIVAFFFKMAVTMILIAGFFVWLP